MLDRNPVLQKKETFVVETISKNSIAAENRHVSRSDAAK